MGASLLSVGKRKVFLSSHFGDGRRPCTVSDVSFQEATLFSAQDVYLCELARDTNVLEGYTFEGCRIRGPAVMLFLGDVKFSQCTFEHRDFIFEIEPNRSFFGMIGIKKISFEGCEFDRIGLAGSREFVGKFKKELLGI